MSCNHSHGQGGDVYCDCDAALRRKQNKETKRILKILKNFKGKKIDKYNSILMKSIQEKNKKILRQKK